MAKVVVHSIRKQEPAQLTVLVTTHCGRQGYRERPGSNEYGTAAGWVFEAIKVEKHDGRITCKNCQRRRL